MGSGDRRAEIAFQRQLTPKIEAARRKIGLTEFIPADEADEYKRIMQEARELLTPIPTDAPAMPLLHSEIGDSIPSQALQDTHQQRKTVNLFIHGHCNNHQRRNES